jgi:hypothetical protein
MKRRVTIILSTIMAVLLLSLILTTGWAESLKILEAQLDKDDRFWVYNEGKAVKAKNRDGDELKFPPYGVPYLPYAWMPKEADTMMKMGVEHKDNPYEGKMCIAVRIDWKDPYWCGVGFVSGPDKGKRGAPWWAKTPHGWYYNLSELREKKLVFHLRGAKGGERVQWKVGFLAEEKYGDSLTFPAETEWLTLETAWKKYELDLKDEDLSRVCSLCFVVSQQWQKDNAPVTFFIDTVYFE